MPTPLSCYVLTYNSERRLKETLNSAREVADEILVVDSGSRDRTKDIALSFGAKFLEREFDNFRDQRVFAEDRCTHDWVLQLDSDEVLSRSLVLRIRDLKGKNFIERPQGPPAEGFAILREWFVLGRKVHVFYPVECPDRVIRLFRRDRIGHRGSRVIHEAARGQNRYVARLDEPLLHYTCDTVDGLYAKINLYTRLSAEDMASRGETSSVVKLMVYPWLHWFRWYVLNGGWKDGRIGLIHARYVRETIHLKYLKLMYDFAPGGSVIRANPPTHGNP